MNSCFHTFEAPVTTRKVSPVGLQLSAWTGWPSWGSNSLMADGEGQARRRVERQRRSKRGEKQAEGGNTRFIWPIYQYMKSASPPSHLNGLMSDFIPLKSYILTM